MGRPTHIRVCKECKSLQKAGQMCSICGCPVLFPDEEALENAREKYKKENPK